ncbi:MAG: hypothetical protein PHS93_01005 [Candidatus Omnitrophica bacterium]|nr:hypothetical protein [Candidatus Omnitrophota bacterium]MDD5351732.1 hypothetical protein [Candidatus Omnitrophota bacterium]MDD5550942.1 hypothetical protein [Candidatus Omnitrophota bacterium]
MYSPKIKEDLIGKMFQIKQKTGKPMTRQVNEAIRMYVSRFEQNESKEATSDR